MKGFDTWWTLHGETLISALREAHDGGNPELIYAELYANADNEDFSEGD